MHESVSFDSTLLPVTAPKLTALSAASLFAKGIFTTLAIYNGVPFVWEKHWRRLEENSTRLGVELNEYDEGKTRRALEDLITANSVQNGRARITFFDESASSVWPYPSERRTRLLISTADMRPVLNSGRVNISPYKINSESPLAGVKSCNYMEKILALNEAKKRGLDEAIQLNERGEVTSACMANVFWLKDGLLFTPSLRTGCLAGTTREFVLEKLACDEVEVGIEALRAADEIFLTSAGLGVAPVAEFEGRRLNLEPHSITNLIHPYR